jgi:hypothetical protein
VFPNGRLAAVAPKWRFGAPQAEKSPKPGSLHLNLELEIYLELGAWNLELWKITFCI